jgi:uncharacterized membrane protein YhdT
VAIVLIVVTITSFCLRSYVRLHMVKAFGLDDWFMLAAAICYILFATVVLIGVHYGTGRLSTDISAEDYSKAMQVSSRRKSRWVEGGKAEGGRAPYQGNDSILTEKRKTSTGSIATSGTAGP